jgi:hypothetical protein
MAARKNFEQQLAELNAIKSDPGNPAAREPLQRALESARAPLTAAGANMIGEHELEGFEPLLSAAFERWMAQPAKSDPACIAKTALVRALDRLGARAHQVYLRGIRHQHLEGGGDDPASELRGLCALALVRSGYFDALREAAELLADPEPTPRMAAAQAIAHSERADVGVPLLRFKALVGDPDPRVCAACFSGLLSLAPDSSLEFVARFTEPGAVRTKARSPAASPDERREAALLALGESRLAGALPVLRRAAEDPLGGEQRASAFVAIALLRNDAAYSYLLGVVRDAGRDQAGDALSALATYRSDAQLRSRALQAVRERAEPQLSARAERLFERA